MLRRSALVAGSIVATMAARDAHAQVQTDGAGSRVSWVREEGAERCPDARVLESRIRARAGSEALAGGPVRIIEGTVRVLRSGQYFAHITLRDARGNLIGSRDLTSSGSDCNYLVSAAAVSIALTLSSAIDLPIETQSSSESADPRTIEHRPNAALDAEVAGRSRVGVPMQSPQEPRRVPRPPWPALHDGIGPVVHAGMLPAVGVGVVLGTEMRLTRYVGMALAFTHLPMQQFTVGAYRHGFGMTYAQIESCIEALDERPTTLALCAGLAVGGREGVMIAAQSIATGEQLWAAGMASIHVRIPVHGMFEVGLDASGIVPFVGDDLVLIDGTRARQTAVAGVTSVRLGVRFQ